MDYGKAFSYPFQDPEWVKKLLIGGAMYLLGFLLIPLFFPMGYMIQVIKNTAEGVEPVLPQWDDWGGLFTKGLMSGLIGIVYMIPLFIIMGIIMFVMIVVTGGLAAADQAGLFSGGASRLLLFWCNIFIFYYSYFLCFIIPAALMRYAVTGEFGAAFKFGELFGLAMKNLGAYIVIILLGGVASFFAWSGMIACGIGVFFTVFYAMLVNANLMGQYYRTVSASASTA